MAQPRVDHGPMCVIVTGMPGAGKSTAQVELTHRNLASLAQNMTSAGVTAVIDVCRARNAGRGEDERWNFENYEGLEAQMTKSFDDIGWWLDTSQLTPQGAADEIIQRIHHRR